jgi:hypothetical protein
LRCPVLPSRSVIRKTSLEELHDKAYIFLVFTNDSPAFSLAVDICQSAAAAPLAAAAAAMAEVTREGNSSTLLHANEQTDRQREQKEGEAFDVM